MAADHSVQFILTEEVQPSSTGVPPQAPPPDPNVGPTPQTTGTNAPRPSTPPSSSQRDESGMGSGVGKGLSNLFGDAFSKSLEAIVGRRVVHFIEQLFNIDLRDTVVQGITGKTTRAKATSTPDAPVTPTAPTSPTSQTQGTGAASNTPVGPQVAIPPPQPPSVPPASPPVGSTVNTPPPIDVPPQAPPPMPPGPVAATGGAGGGAVAGGAGGATAGGAGGGAAGAAMGAGSVAGPIGLGIAAGLVIAIGGSIIAFKALNAIISRVDEEMGRLVETQKNFSGPVALANALNQIKEIESQLRRANATQGDLSQIESMRGDTKTILTDMYTEVLQPMLPIVREGAESLVTILKTLEPALKIIMATNPKTVENLWNLANKYGGAFLEPMKTLLQNIAASLDKEEEDKADQFAAELQKFLNDEFLLRADPPIRRAPRRVL